MHLSPLDRIGAWFSPFIPLMGSIKLVLVFYARKVSYQLLVACTVYVFVKPSKMVSAMMSRQTYFKLVPVEPFWNNYVDKR